MANAFRAQTSQDFTIVDSASKVVGHIRVKPSGIAWHPPGRGKWRRLTLKQFADLAEEHGSLVSQ
jgi:hypothetical protein